MNLKKMLPLSIFEEIDRAGLSTSKQIIVLSVLDIQKYTHLSIDDILLVKSIVSESVSPKIVRCNELINEEAFIKTRISTGCNAINEVLKGGLRRGTLTEIFGESGSGKTQLAINIALNNWMDGCVYICTEDWFPTKRFIELKKCLPAFNETIDYGKNVFVEHVSEASELLSCISVRLPKLLTQNKLSVVIIDSIAAPFRCESSNYIRRAEDLREVAVLLTTIAQKHNLAIVCINQVTASFDDSSSVLPSLGLAWSNMVSTRLRIKKTSKTIDFKYQKSCAHNYIRELSIAFAPDLPNTIIEFIIISSGIQAYKI